MSIFKSSKMRRSGRTTKLVDKYIQTLFTTGKVLVHDHHHTNNADRNCFNMVINRLLIEHFAGDLSGKVLPDFNELSLKLIGIPLLAEENDLSKSIGEVDPSDNSNGDFPDENVIEAYKD